MTIRQQSFSEANITVSNKAIQPNANTQAGSDPGPSGPLPGPDFEALAEHSPVGIWQVDIDGNTVYGNPALCALLGAPSLRELSGQNFRRFFTPENIAKIETQLALRWQGISGNYEVELTTAQGERRAVIIAGTPVVDPDGSVVGTIGTLIDISERKQTEEALRASEARSAILSKVVEQSSSSVVVTDIAGTIEYVNPAFCERTGYTAQEALGKNPRILKSGATTTEEYAGLWATIAAGNTWTGEFKNQTKQGEFFQEKARIFPIRDDQGQITHYAAVKDDVTQLKQAEEAERDQRALAQALSETILLLGTTDNNEMMLDQILDNLRQVVPCDLAAMTLIEDGAVKVAITRGLDGPGLTDWLAQMTFSIERSEGVEQARRTALAAQKFVTQLNKHEDAPEIINNFETYLGAPIHLKGKLIGYMHLFSLPARAFTEQDGERLINFSNQMAAALHNAELYRELENYSSLLEEAVEKRTREITVVKDRVEAILNNSPDAILLLDINCKIDAVNPAFTELSGLEIEAIYGKALTKTLDVSQPSQLQEALDAVLAALKPRRFETALMFQPDRVYDMDIILAPITTNHGMRGVVCSLRDISALKEVERLKDAFVSNVSHELRTPITGLKLNHRLLTMDPAGHDKYMDRLGREIDRLNMLIEDLLRLSRLDQGRMELHLRSMDLRDVVEQLASDRAAIAAEKELTLIAIPRGQPISAQVDEGLLGQALSVLLTNAINYTPAGGSIEVSVVDRQQGGQQWGGIRVADSGPGIEAEEIPQLFTRFYRGKAGRDTQVPGTGLGLAIASEIVTLHQGEIEVIGRAPGRGGAIFTLWIPVDSDG